MSRFRLPVMFGVAVLAVSWGWSQPRPMSIVDLIEVPSISDGRLSPDGSEVVFELAEADWKQNKQVRHLWRVGIDGEGLVQLTNGENGEQDPRWSPDGRWIAFRAKRGSDENTQIYLLRNSGGEALRLTSHETSVSSISWAPDGGSLYFLASDPESPENKKRKKVKDDIFPFDEDYEQRHLWRVRIEESGHGVQGSEQRLSEGDYSIIGYDLSPDGSRLVLQRSISPLIDNRDEGEIWVAGADGSDARKLTSNTITESSAQLSPDNGAVLFLARSNAELDTYYNSNLFLVPALGGDARVPFPDFPYDIQRAAWSRDGSRIYADVNMGIHSQLFVLDPASGETEQLTEGRHALGGWHYSPAADRHLVSRGQADNPGDLWTLPAAGGEELSRVTRVFEHLAEQFQLPRQEAVRWKSNDGTEVEGLLIYPVGYQEGRRYPLIVQTHGGPAASDKYGFGGGNSRYNPVLAGKGYLILRPNYRGSTGYGNAFLRDMVGSYFRNAHLDVMSGVDHLIERGLADPDRLIKMGWSAGGHMTNKIITFTDRFKAASSGAGAVNWVSMYGQSDVRTYRTPWFGGTPWQKDAPIATYWENSPLKDIWKVTTPTLVLVGGNDVRVPPPQSVELHRALKANGVPTKLYIAPREPHGWRELRHRLFKMNVELDWFARYALGEEYEWESAPEEAKEEKEAEPVLAGTGS